MFKYSAQIKWPTPQPQTDWVDQELTLTKWLEQHVGSENQTWRREVDTIAFKRAKDRTLFLIAFG